MVSRRACVRSSLSLTILLLIVPVADAARFAGSGVRLSRLGDLDAMHPFPAFLQMTEPTIPQHRDPPQVDSFVDHSFTFPISHPITQQVDEQTNAPVASS